MKSHSRQDIMKTLIVFAITFLVGTSGYLIKIPTGPSQPNTAPQRWMHLQKQVLPLFENVCEDSNDPVIIRTAQEFTSETTSENYWKPDVYSNFQKLKSGKGFLPKGQIFTEYNNEHLNEFEVVYDLLYYAKNFDLFYKAAAWARQNLNCGLYLNAIYLAIVNRRDTERLVVPAPYELLPNYFIRKDVILEATNLAAGVNIEPSEGVHVEGNAYQLDANYTSIFYDNNDESILAYFREDVGLNSYYFIRKLKQAPWFNTGIDGRYGENVYHMMKQFMARYNLERYANGLPELESWSWNDPDVFDVPYDPMLIYTNGNEFISRTSPVELPDNEAIALLQTIENNIGTVVSHMRDGGYNKTQILNHLMEILVTGDRSYETLARQLLGKARSDNGCPSVLEHYMTSLRDPMFWKLNKKIVDIVDSALKIIPPYSRNELYFPGVEVMNIDVKKMMTFYDYFEFDVTDALKTAADNTTFQVKIGQPRLNHRPFTIKINVSSLVTQRAVVKVYLGPKILPGELAKKKNLYTLLDRFEYRLKIGSNIITRISDDMKQFSEDFMSINTLRKKVADSEFGLDSLPLKTIESQIGYPARLILPKGSLKGLPLQLFVFVAPYAKYSAGGTYSLANMEFNKAILSPGYPLDLMVQDKQIFELPNAMVKDIVVTHKGAGKVENYGGPGVSKKWYGNTYDPSSRPNNPGNRKEPFDYNSRKGQYDFNEEKETVEITDYELKEEQEYNLNDSFEEHYVMDENDNRQYKLGATNFDYSAKSTRPIDKQPFDYKAKKGQYGKKSNYTQNRGEYKKDFKKDNIYTTTTTEADVPLDELDMDVGKVILEKDVISKEVQINTDLSSEAKNDTENNIFYNKLGATKFDYAAKSTRPIHKQPFDYKAKKGQYGKKSNYTQNRGEYKKDFRKENVDTSTSKADFPLDKLDMNVGKVILEKDVISKEVQINTDLPSEAKDDTENNIIYNKLGATKFDYAAKSTRPIHKQPFDYKAKKGQYGKKNNYTQNRDEYKKDFRKENVDTSTSKADFPLDKLDMNVGKVILEKDVISKEVQINTDLPSEAKDDTENNIIYNKLGATKFDYAAKSTRPIHKQPFDYKAKKGQYGKKSNYTQNRGEYKKDFRKENVYSSTTKADVPLDKLDMDVGKVILEKDVISKEVEKNTNLSSEAEDDTQNDDLYNMYTIKPVAPTKRYSVYDFIIHVLSNDTSEEKVYE